MNNFEICKTCQHRKTDFSGNLYCGYNIEPSNNISCSEYTVDEMEKIRTEVQQAKLNRKVSGGIRFANYIIDFIAYLFISVILGVILGVVSALTGMDISWLDTMGKLSEYFMGFILMSSYYIFFEGIFGQTLGKMATGTKVVTDDGQKPDIITIIKRTLCRFIPFEAFSFLGSDAYGWHDSLSNTRVVYK